MTTETRKRRNYTEDFKRDAVALVTEQGYKPSEAARSLGIGDNLVRPLDAGVRGSSQRRAAQHGWAMDRRMQKALVIRALLMAINLRQPPPGLLHHSDRGSQYASHAYQSLLKQHGMICGMSRKGNCWDNAPTERFFSSLKREWTGDRWYRTRQEAMADVRKYVTVYYNSKRLHSTLGCKTPMNYE
jgi:transposase InsO family protein